MSTERIDIGQVFIKDEVQKLLKDITRFEESKIFARSTVPRLKTPKIMFMSNEQLEIAKQNAYENIKARLQMPPVMAADNSKPEILAQDDEIVGYTKFKVMFVDISSGSTNRERLMSVRETDGKLRFPTYEERSRLNHIFYPNPQRSIDPPKLFEEKNLLRLLKKQEYVYILNRACIQFEPDDPRYVDVTTRVYNYIDERRDYDKLRSTRHFGPMSLYLTYNNLTENLINEMTRKGFAEDVEKIHRISKLCEKEASGEAD